MNRIAIASVGAVAGALVLTLSACSSPGPTSITVGPPAAGDSELPCTNRRGVALDPSMDARGAPTVEEALAHPPSRIGLPGGALVASQLPARPNTYLLTRGGKSVGTVEVSPVNGGWVITGVQACS